MTLPHIYYIIGAVSYAIFIIQFILSLAGWDTDIDLDMDGEGDFSLGDLVSFKGLVHFLLGATTYLCYRDYTGAVIDKGSYLMAAVIGLAVMVVLFVLYRLMMRLEHRPLTPSGHDLIGCKGRVTLVVKKDNVPFCIPEYDVMLDTDFGTVRVTAICADFSKEYRQGETVEILDYTGKYYII